MTNENKPVFDLSSIQSPEIPNDSQKGFPAPLQSWPDRSAPKPPMIQISVRATPETVQRLKDVCHSERYSYGEMLELLLDAYDEKGRGL